MKKRADPHKIDKENPAWTGANFSQAKPAGEVLPHLFSKETSARLLKPRGRPRLPDAKIAISLRIQPDVLAAWKASGNGWQTRMAEALARSAPKV